MDKTSAQNKASVKDYIASLDVQTKKVECRHYRV